MAISGKQLWRTGSVRAGAGAAFAFLAVANGIVSDSRLLAVVTEAPGGSGAGGSEPAAAAALAADAVTGAKGPCVGCRGGSGSVAEPNAEPKGAEPKGAEPKYGTATATGMAAASAVELAATEAGSPLACDR